MINLISNAIPWIGGAICAYVIMTHKINTKCPIRIAKMCIWVAIWSMFILSGRGQFFISHDFTVMFAKLLMLIISVLYIVEASLYAPRRRKSMKRSKINGGFKNKV